MKVHDYEHWYIGGHSLGGTAAASFAASHAAETDGLVLLAAYPTGKLPDLKMLSVYGTEDGCLEPEAYEEARQYWPPSAVETVIPGGNHAQFGSYGAQKGDGQASMKAAEQQKQTSDEIIRWIENQ